ncbi:MAG: hypothetical protein WCR56_04405 [Bacilli bacterium]
MPIAIIVFSSILILIGIVLDIKSKQKQKRPKIKQEQAKYEKWKIARFMNHPAVMIEKDNNGKIYSFKLH